MCFAVRPHHLCRARSPDPDPFVIRRAQTTAVGPMRRPLTVGRGTGPRMRHAHACGFPAPCTARGGQAPALRYVNSLCRARSPDLDLFGSGRSRTTEVVSMRRPLHRRARACPSPVLAQSNARGGQAPALRYVNSLCRAGAPAPDPFGSGRSRTTAVGPMPAGTGIEPRGLAYGCASKYETSSN